MERREFVLNDVFIRNAKDYSTRPVKATKYKPGIENGWMIYMSAKIKVDDISKLYEGIKFFDTKEEAMDYVEKNDPQYVNYNGKRIACEVEYDLLRPVMYRKYTEGEERLGVDMGIKGYTFVSDESEIYDFYILEEDTWIILDADGNIRVWEHDYLDICSTFFGEPEDFVYQKIEDKYIKVAI